jgi:ubiquinone/menaquinone biosynthesis C-methylase UbiE
MQEGDAMEQAPWQFVGTPPEFYEHFLATSLFGDWTPALVALAAPQPGERVLDLACTTGGVARAVAPLVGPAGRVTGLDVSAQFVAFARTLPLPAGIAIDWVEGDACAMTLPDAAYDLILCQQGMNHFPDKAAAAREMLRVLSPGGRLVLSVWSNLAHNSGFLVWITALEHHPHLIERMAMPRTKLSSAARALHDLLVAAGFRDVVVRRDVRMGRFASIGDAIRQQVSQFSLPGGIPLIDTLDAEARQAILDAAQQQLGSYEDIDGFAFPLEAWVATARKAG